MSASPPSRPSPTWRPPFILSTTDIEEKLGTYPNSTERLAYRRTLGVPAGLQRIGLHVCRLPPGTRTSFPHAEENEEEFVFVLQGDVDAWIDGHLYPLKKGDLAAFPAGTGICHTFLNNGADDALLLVGGERSKADNRLYYPLNPERKNDLAPGEWWDNVPQRPLGEHDGIPRKR
jgi:uncharacterized cupin superfamily protein